MRLQPLTSNVRRSRSQRLFFGVAARAWAFEASGSRSLHSAPGLSSVRGRPIPGGAQGSVLIIVLWIAFGLVCVALYFGHAMVFEYRASEQNAAGVAADQAIEGAARYISYVLTNTVLTNIAETGLFPETNYLRCEAVPVGDAAFWFIGRADSDAVQDIPTYGLIDEASKLNLNTATLTMLQTLPRMTVELAAAIVDWRDTNTTVTTGGAESETYMRLSPPYLCKDTNFETTEELRLVAGATVDVLYGEDVNMNGVLDPNENDGATSLPDDNRDGKLDPGILEYLTVYTSEPNVRADGSARLDVNAPQQPGLAERLQEALGQERGRAISIRVAPLAGQFRSLLEFYLRSQMTAQEFAQVAGDLSVTNATKIPGLVNVNTATAAVLACIPGIGSNSAPQLVAYRRANSSQLTTVAWVLQVLTESNAIQAGPYITTRSYQFSADVVAMGPYGRGYRRSFMVFDVSDGNPKIVYRRDRSRLGWALGAETRQPWWSGKELSQWHF
jgi:DNA uptake protein ComE-like DNA-binding protein